MADVARLYSASPEIVAALDQFESRFLAVPADDADVCTANYLKHSIRFNADQIPVTHYSGINRALAWLNAVDHPKFIDENRDQLRRDFYALKSHMDEELFNQKDHVLGDFVALKGKLQDFQDKLQELENDFRNGHSTD